MVQTLYSGVRVFDISRQPIEANSGLLHGAIQKAPPSVADVLKVAEARFMFDQGH
jgi:hypothetical protein